MCGLAGYLTLKAKNRFSTSSTFDRDFLQICKRVALRGLDCFGFYTVLDQDFSSTTAKFKSELPAEPEQFTLDPEAATVRNSLIASALEQLPFSPTLLLGNFRGIPTTEALPGEDQLSIQPFIHTFPNAGTLTVTHNGLLSNDGEIMRARNFSPIMEEKDIDSYLFLHLYNYWSEQNPDDSPVLVWELVLREIQGSYAVVLYDQDHNYLHFARNYLGLWFALYLDPVSGVYHLAWASEEQAFFGTDYESIFEVPAGTFFSLDLKQFFELSQNFAAYPSAIVQLRRAVADTFCFLDQKTISTSAAVVLSGGLDSTTVAAWACQNYQTVHLLHYHYGALAQDQEKLACERIAAALQIQYPRKWLTLDFISIELFKTLGGSTLTDPALQEEISDGETGVEAPKEWVPARNLVLLSLGAAYCDRHNIEALMLGFNREESGAFPDNSSEFYDACREPLSTGTLSKTQIVSPVGNLMKRHIVKLAHELEAPIHLSWSCYRNGPLHCGACAPCYLRLKAHQMDGTPESVAYATYPEWFPVKLRCEIVLEQNRE